MRKDTAHRAQKADERQELIRGMYDEIVNLVDSPLYGERIKNNYHPVVGQGSYFAKIMFIGEAPGKNEARTGLPFCGRAGKILDMLLRSVEIPRRTVYITNIVNDRPPKNRDPKPEEIALYAPFLDRHIGIIKPKAIITLGRFSMAYCMEKFGLFNSLAPISVIHGRIFNVEAPYGAISLVPLYHPAAAIYNPAIREVMENDFQILKNLNK